MDRETKELTTPAGKHKVVIKAWLTGGEKRALRRPFLEGMNISLGEDGKPKTNEFNSANMIEKAEDMAIETVIISIDGKTDNILKSVLDMESEDTEFIIAELNKITQGVDFQKPRQKQ